MKLKVVSDGTREGTTVVNAETGEELEGVIAVTWEGRGDKPETFAQISLMKVAVEVVGWEAVNGG